MPKGFEFRFENLLSFNLRKENEAKMQLSEAVQKMEQERKALEHLKIQYNDTLYRWNESMREQCRVSKIRLQSTQIQWLAERVATQQNMYIKAEERTEKCRLQLVEAKKESLKFEKIKVKDYEQFQQMEQKMESATMDQFVTHLSSRR